MDGKPKLVAFDLDGTLAESKSPVSATIGALLSKLLQKMPVAILSGAAFKQYEHQFFPALAADTNLGNLYIFPDNAAECYVYKNGTWILQYGERFADTEKDQVLAALDAALEQSSTQLHIPRTWGAQIEDRGAQITFSALGQEAPVEEKQKWDPTREKRRPLYNLLVTNLPEFSIGLNATTSIDITKHGINKAYGIQKLSEMTGIAVADMLYVGDALQEGGNDSVVIPTGVKTHQVSNPEETKKLIEQILTQ